jgi:mitochondrial chaperone BCS1
MQEIIEWTRLQIQTNQFFGAAAFASVLAGIFAYVKGFPNWLWDRILVYTMYRVTIYQTEELYDYIMMWMRDNHKSKTRNVEYTTRTASYDGNEYVKEGSASETDKNQPKKIREIPIEDFFYLRKYGRILRISFGRDKLENANNLKSVYLKHFTIRGFFAARAIRKLIGEINQTYGQRKRDPNLYITNDHYFRHIGSISGKPLSQIVINNKLKQNIISDINTWKSSKDEYIRRGIAHKRGHCYYGPPGTGKTSLSKAIAIEYQMDVYMVNLNNVSGDDDLITMFREVQPNSMILFEDIDAYFDGRSSMNGKSNVTFSGLLNALDGVSALQGILVVITTNHLEKLDPALIRPGRIDKINEIGLATSVEASEYLSMFYNGNYSINLKENTSMCNIQNACLMNLDNVNGAIECLENNKG